MCSLIGLLQSGNSGKRSSGIEVGVPGLFCQVIEESHNGWLAKEEEDIGWNSRRRSSWLARIDSVKSFQRYFPFLASSITVVEQKQC